MGVPERKLLPYFRHPRVEITIVVDGELREIAPRHANEVFIVRDPWYPVVVEPAVRRHRSQQAALFDSLYFISATEELDRARRAAEFNSHFVNQGCFVNPETFAPVPGQVKDYDAVITARFAITPTRELVGRCLHRARHARELRDRLREIAQLRFVSGKHCEAKRHWLTQRLSRLALLDPVNGDAPPAMKQHYRDRPGTAFCNDERLSPEEVGRIVARSHCGLAFSPLEGFCRASSECLLSGVPVVSTRSTGGRDVWYDRYNSIIVEPDVDAVYEAVQRPSASSATRREFALATSRSRKCFRSGSRATSSNPSSAASMSTSIRSSSCAPIRFAGGNSVAG